MDIVTHGMMGVAIAGPWLASHPAASAGFILGSVIPDLDAFSRCGGKQAFLTWHQGWTHSLFGILLAGFVFWWLLKATSPELAGLPIGLAAGATLHVLLDLTNTYGVRLFSPFTQKRFCLEWVFFIDSVVIVMTTGTVAIVASYLAEDSARLKSLSVGYVIALASYFAVKGLLRLRASTLCGRDVVAIIPSALWPWSFYVCQRQDSQVTSSQLNVLTGTSHVITTTTIFDTEFRRYLEPLPEFQAMAALSPAYHVVKFARDGEKTFLCCRDMRIINFGTSFGRLDVTLSPDFEVLSAELHV